MRDLNVIVEERCMHLLVCRREDPNIAEFRIED